MKKRRNPKQQTERKIVFITLLSLLIIFTSAFAIALSQNISFGITIDSNKESELVGVKANDTIAHQPKFISVDVKLPKREQTPTMPNIPAGSKVVALTFDDGPGRNSTQRILNILNKHNVKATWFVLGSKADQNPDMLRQIAANGHEVNNHSYSHANLVNLSIDGALNEINSTQNSVQNIIGKKPAYLRPPYGSYNTAIANAVGLGIAMWNVDSLDWKFKNGNAAYNHVLSTLVDNPVILFHDIYETSADAVEMLVPKLIEQGYTFVTYSQYRQMGG